MSNNKDAETDDSDMRIVEENPNQEQGDKVNSQ